MSLLTIGRIPIRALVMGKNLHSRAFSSVVPMAPKKIIYFGINCKCNSTATICLELSRLPYEVQIVDMAKEWPDMKPTMPTGSLPVIELQDGTLMGESAVCKRTCAAAADLLGENQDYVKSEFLVTMMEDLWKDDMFPILPNLLNMDKWDKEQTKKCNEHWPKVEKSLKDLEKYLLPKGDRFTRRGVLVGEIDLWHRLNMMAGSAWPQAVEGGLKAFYDRMQEVKGIKRFREGESKWGKVANLMVPIPEGK